jgi:threonylcarbamoyladenosine tRNA methylthiotransferase MtaB
MEVNEKVQNGFKEIVLIGIHLASYGKDLKNITLIDVLEKLEKIEGLQRIRLGSLEPLFINEENIERLKKMDKVCKHFHLSLQSGCTETLKRMNRRYTAEEYEERVNMIRKAFPYASITTDIIVGFPGETEEEFLKTYEYLKRIKLNRMHVFPYSIRKGTLAEKMPMQIEKNIKNERAKSLIELSLKNEIEFANKFINKEVDVLLEKGKKGKYRQGYTREYVKVLFEGGKAGEQFIGIGKNVTDEGELVVEKS